MNLDEFQKKAAFQNNKHSLIIAGAGTGKTYTLIGRIQYLLEEEGLNPEEILVISYTNETVLEFQEKIKNKLGVNITVYTFHKLAMYLLEKTDFQYTLISDDMLKFITEEFLVSYCRYQKRLRKSLLHLCFFGGFGSLDNPKCKKKLEQIKKDLITFVHLFSAKGLTTTHFLKYYFKVFGKEKHFLLLGYTLMQLYQSEKESQHFLDFDDLISQGEQCIVVMKDIPFRHILIDEFQDSSMRRILFLEALIKKFDLSFTAVGDDCQSIYRFSGTETDCFSLLKKSFSDLETFYLKYTYRNSQELIHVANQFVQKNPRQIRKEICSTKHLEYPIEILSYHNEQQIYRILRYILNNTNGDILFLGRNSFDWKYYFKDYEIHWINNKLFSLKKIPNRVFTFMTVHQSKGLEADYVILLHVENSIYGFPNQVKNPKYLRFVSSKDFIRFEEERRLFYVALTRTKEKIFILAPILNCSPFVKELLTCKSVRKKFF